ncbi:hypothetical protein [Nesterenkonia sandarakina]|uniref:Uncharacterized protein n=1 Tax=Nesterenkonia sandarakina TaxID=272918 RepID=A0A7Z0J2H0_9MICC|nr:hypothetical protein [Nesterenkonia sandarakina]NYJ16265.1 hypothetical protein [Nesterenkonia sandarakina]
MTTLPPAGPADRSHSWGSSRFLAWALFVILGSTGAWFAWMGWDQEYQVDPVTGLAHGPYEAWQVIGCGITLLAVAVPASWGRHWKSVLLLPPSFTVAWSVTAASEDSSGLWLVGAIMVLIGSSLGTAVVLGVTGGVESLLGRIRRPGAPREVGSGHP